MSWTTPHGRSPAKIRVFALVFFFSLSLLAQRFGQQEDKCCGAVHKPGRDDGVITPSTGPGSGCRLSRNVLENLALGKLRTTCTSAFYLAPLDINAGGAHVAVCVHVLLGTPAIFNANLNTWVDLEDPALQQLQTVCLGFGQRPSPQAGDGSWSCSARRSACCPGQWDAI